MTPARYEWRVLDGLVHLVIAAYADTLRTACQQIHPKTTARDFNDEPMCPTCVKAGR